MRIGRLSPSEGELSALVLALPLATQAERAVAGFVRFASNANRCS